MNIIQINKAAKIYAYCSIAHLEAKEGIDSDEQRVVEAAIEFAERELAKLGYSKEEARTLQDCIERVSKL